MLGELRFGYIGADLGHGRLHDEKDDLAHLNCKASLSCVLDDGYGIHQLNHVIHT